VTALYRGPSLRRFEPGDDRGLMAVELAILTPVAIAMLLVVVAFGRVTQARQLVDQAAAAGARAASLSTSPGQAATEARQSVRDTLARAGVSCSGPVVDVDTTEFRPGGQGPGRCPCSMHGRPVGDGTDRHPRDSDADR
jgi:Flp pilus assembly protein TadG